MRAKIQLLLEKMVNIPEGLSEIEQQEFINKVISKLKYQEKGWVCADWLDLCLLDDTITGTDLTSVSNESNGVSYKHIYEPFIRWTGSKRSQAKEIVSYFPDQINEYFEPFCGGCSVAIAFADTEKRYCNIICSDIDQNLINCFCAIYDPTANIPYEYKGKIFVDKYKELWEKFNNAPKEQLFQHRKDYYKIIKNRFNEKHLVTDFFFLNRTSYNGLIRYNQAQEFNTSCHFSRPGIDPQKLESIVKDLSQFLYHKNFFFKTQPYWDCQPTKGDFVYFDPPYLHSQGKMYHNAFQVERFWDYIEMLNTKEIKFALSLDGISGDDDYTNISIPKELYKKHIYIKSGNSSFKRLKGQTNTMVYESLYLNF